MKLTIFLLLTTILGSMAAGSYSQSAKLTLDFNNSTIKEILGNIEDQSEFRFFYSGSINVERRTSISLKNEKIFDVLDELFEGTGVNYEVRGRQIALVKGDETFGFESVQTAQQPAVSGTVADESGEPLPGVTVVVKGTTQGTVTNADGNYSLSNIPEDATLQFTFVGMRTQEIEVDNQTTINVTMEVDAIGIEEVVAVGYGTMKRSDLTGSVSQISSDEFDQLAISDPLVALQGRIPGLQITPISGQPGVGSEILIHGKQSISGTNSPIFVVDGTITENIDHLNPLDIEKFSILKDASAVAIYGSRAANGVILVTTKRGDSTQKTKITFRTDQSIQQEGNLQINYLNADQWLELATEAWENAGLSVPWTDEQLAEVQGVDVDWPNVVKRTGAISNYDLSVSGGGKGSNYFISLNHMRHKGIIIGQDYQKMNLRLNSDHNINDRIAFGHSINLFSAEQNSKRNYDNGNPYNAAFRYTPFNRMYEEDGDFGIIRNFNLQNPPPNPLWMVENSDVTNSNKGVSGNIYLSINILEGLKFTTRGSLNWTEGYNTSFIGAMNPKYNMFGSNVNEIEKTKIETAHWITDFLLDYNKTFNDENSLRFLLGHSVEEQTYEDLQGLRGDTPNNSIRFLSAGDPSTAINSNTYDDWAFASQFGRIEYTLKNKYIISGTIRRDGTSRLSGENKYGIFPSISAAWRIGQEKFLNQSEWIDDLKLRASWGTIGNILGISSYETVNNLTQRNYIMNQKPVSGYTATDAINTDLSWESTTKKNIGLDAYLFDNKFYVMSDFFIEDTYDLLFQQPIPYSTGLSGRPYINAGHIRNKGFDIEAGYRKNVGEWSYNFNINLSRIKNEVIDLEGRDLMTSGIAEGYPIGTFFGYVSNGIIRNQEELNNNPHYPNKQVGDIWLLDIDGYDEDGELTGEPDGKVDAADRTLFGKVFPDVTSGLSGSIGYKNLTLQFHIQSVIGLDKNMLAGGYVIEPLDLFTGQPNSEADYILDRFHPEKNPDGKFPRVSVDGKGSNTLFSDFWLIDASNLSIRNINLNYNIPQSLFNEFGVQDFNIHLGVQNLYTFGNEYADITSIVNVPIPRTLTLGLKISF